MTEPRAVTLATSDFGPVTLTCPAWCAGHSHHDPETARADLMHAGPAVDFTHLGTTVFSAEIVQSPHAAPGPAYLGGRTPGVSVHPLGKTLDPVQIFNLAAALDRYADRLRDLGDQLTAVLNGGAE